jgi:hypothetical protein
VEVDRAVCSFIAGSRTGDATRVAILRTAWSTLSFRGARETAQCSNSNIRQKLVRVCGEEQQVA